MIANLSFSIGYEFIAIGGGDALHYDSTALGRFYSRLSAMIGASGLNDIGLVEALEKTSGGVLAVILDRLDDMAGACGSTILC